MMGDVTSSDERPNPEPPPFRVGVFCGSSDGLDPAFGVAATALGSGIARRGWGVVYGGASVGLMGIVADSALAWGGEVIGVLPAGLFRDEVAHGGLTILHEVDGMLNRKALMAELADAFVVLPGGLGTLDELFEMVTWSQLDLHPRPKPTALVDVAGYWSPLSALLDGAHDAGFLRAEHRRLVSVAVDAESALDMVGMPAGSPPPASRGAEPTR